MKKLIFLTVGVSLLTLLGFFGAQKMYQRMATSHIPSSITTLGRTPEEKKTLKQLEETFRQNTEQLCIRVCQTRLTILNMMEDKNMPAEKIYKKIEEVGAEQILLEKETATHILEVSKHLTPAQSRAYLSHFRKELEASLPK